MQEGSISNNNARQGTCVLTTSPLANQKCTLQMKKQKHPWYVHQSTVHIVQGYYNYTGYLCKKQLLTKRKRIFKIHHQCEEYTVINGAVEMLCISATQYQTLKFETVTQNTIR